MKRRFIIAILLCSAQILSTVESFAEALAPALSVQNSFQITEDLRKAYIQYRSRGEMGDSDPGILRGAFASESLVPLKDIFGQCFKSKSNPSPATCTMFNQSLQSFFEAAAAGYVKIRGLNSAAVTKGFEEYSNTGAFESLKPVIQAAIDGGFGSLPIPIGVTSGLPGKLDDLVAQASGSSLIAKINRHRIVRFLSTISAEGKEVAPRPEYVSAINKRRIVAAFMALGATGYKENDVLKTIEEQVLQDSSLTLTGTASINGQPAGIKVTANGKTFELKAPTQIVDSPLKHFQNQVPVASYNERQVKEQYLHERAARLSSVARIIDNAFGKITELWFGTYPANWGMAPSINMLKAFKPSSPMFLVKFNPDHWTRVNPKLRGKTQDQLKALIQNQFRSEAIKSGVPVTILDSQTLLAPSPSLGMAVPWARDATLQATQRDGKKLSLVSLKNDDDPDFQSFFGTGGLLPDPARKLKVIDTLIDGGGMRAIGDRFFISGGDAVRARSDGLPPEQASKMALKLYEVRSQREVEVVGEGLIWDETLPYTASHIDLYTLFIPTGGGIDEKTGKRRKEIVLVASLLDAWMREKQAGADVVMSELIRAEQAGAIYKSRNSQTLWGTMDEDRATLLALNNNFADHLGISGETPPMELVMAEDTLNKIADELKAKGYDVRRVPTGPVTYDGTFNSQVSDSVALPIKPFKGLRWIPWFDGNGLVDNSNTTQYTGFDFSQLNGLQEVYIDEAGKLIRRFYMPTSGVTAIEKPLVSTLNSLGYEVVPVPGFVSASRGSGLLNCWTQERRD